MTYNQYLFKTGACSIILGSGHYGNYFTVRNKLLKITKITDMHNDFTHLDEIRQIKNYKNYYTIPDELNYIIRPTDKFYHYLQQIVQKQGMSGISILSGNINCNYIDYAGDVDLLDTMEQLIKNNRSNIWNSYSSIYKFIYHMLIGLGYLHKQKLCHLDIKPENIIVDTDKKTFKIIDFGFCSKEPFTDYLNDIRGTPGYFPKFFPNEKITEWFPKIEANDMILIDNMILIDDTELINNKVPMQNNYHLVYKIDSYCLGRVLYALTYTYKNYSTVTCVGFSERHKRKKLIDITNELLENNVYKRLTITEIIDKYL
jgi:serine/threonine protein kinase